MANNFLAEQRYHRRVSLIPVSRYILRFDYQYCVKRDTITGM